MFNTGLLPSGDELSKICESYAKEEIEAPRIRDDGKEICAKRREMRIAIAKANNIFYAPRECKYDGSCAGTCEACDEESLYIYNQLLKRDINDRVYPKFEIEVSE